jgi:hypothetical protein
MNESAEASWRRIDLERARRAVAGELEGREPASEEEEKEASDYEDEDES